jgi:thiol-disulfide isomerase/thioredoxin
MTSVGIGSMRVLLTALAVLPLLVGCGRDETPVALAAEAQSPPSPWPPRVGEPYPDLRLVDQTGQPVALSSFKGSVILIEMIGMTCPACQAFSGANRIGSFRGVTPTGGLPSIDELVPDYARGVAFPGDDVVFVQLLLFNMEMEPPTPEDAAAWAAHFHRDRARRQYVLAGGPALHNRASYVMVPGFQLVDRHFVLRWDATGHSPRHNLYRELLPALPGLLRDE